MEDFVFTKMFPNGEWANINLSEMARLLQDQYPQSEIIVAGKEASQKAGTDKALRERRRIKGRT